MDAEGIVAPWKNSTTDASCEATVDQCIHNSLLHHVAGKIVRTTESAGILEVEATPIPMTVTEPHCLSSAKEIAVLASTATGSASLFPPPSVVPIVIKVRKPRRKGDKPLVKVVLTDPNQIHNYSPQELNYEISERSADGVKKKMALESLRQAQGLFRFIPRSTSTSEPSSSVKLLKGTKSVEEVTEQSMASAVLANSTLNCASATRQYISTDSRQLIDTSCIQAHQTESGSGTVSGAASGYSSLSLSGLGTGNIQRVAQTDLCTDKDQKQKVKAKPKVKEEKKKVAQKVEAVPIFFPEGLHVSDLHNNGDRTEKGDVLIQVNENTASTVEMCDRAVQEVVTQIDKIRTKRKYTFQHPLVRKIAALATSAPKTVDTSDSENGADLGSLMIKSQPLLSARLLARSDSLDTESNSAMDETVGVCIEDEDDVIRLSASHTDMDCDSAAAVGAKVSRVDKKDIVKRLGRGESKDCSMADVPGRHLLGSKMLAFIKAFPEGDVIGNDDVETAATQRVRMESWLQLMKRGSTTFSSASSSGPGSSQLTHKLGRGNSEEYRDDSKQINQMKSDLLMGIEEKLLRAGSTGGRTYGTSLSSQLKPGIVQVLLPYEVRT